MLALRPCCEHCAKPLPPESEEAMVCSFECTYCKTCALELFENVCPSCSGNFVPRPIRPKSMLAKYPPSTATVYAPKSLPALKAKQEAYRNIPPAER